MFKKGSAVISLTVILIYAGCQIPGRSGKRELPERSAALEGEKEPDLQTLAESDVCESFEGVFVSSILVPALSTGCVSCHGVNGALEETAFRLPFESRITVAEVNSLPRSALAQGALTWTNTRFKSPDDLIAFLANSSAHAGVPPLDSAGQFARAIINFSDFASQPSDCITFKEGERSGTPKVETKNPFENLSAGSEETCKSLGEIYETHLKGTLALECAQCHDQNPSKLSLLNWGPDSLGVDEKRMGAVFHYIAFDPGQADFLWKKPTERVNHAGGAVIAAESPKEASWREGIQELSTGLKDTQWSDACAEWLASDHGEGG